MFKDFGQNSTNSNQYLWSHYILVLGSNNFSVLHRFREITKFNVHVTAYVTLKYINFDNLDKITSHKPFP